MDIKKKAHKPSRLTGLYKQKEKFIKKRDTLRASLKDIQRQLYGVNKRLKALDNELNSINNRETIICDHAFDRFRERIKDLPNKEISKIVLTPQLENMINTLGNGTYPGDGFRCTVVDNRIVTILEP